MMIMTFGFKEEKCLLVNQSNYVFNQTQWDKNIELENTLAFLGLNEPNFTILKCYCDTFLRHHL